MTHKSHNERGVFFAGSFNPFTIGHASIVERALALFDRVVVGIGYNEQKPAGGIEARLEAIRAVYADEPRVEVMAYSGLTIDAAKKAGCVALLRGVRTAADFEYERTLADANRHLSGLETVLLYSLPELAWVSSSAVRELAHNGVDITPYLPKPKNTTNK